MKKVIQIKKTKLTEKLVLVNNGECELKPQIPAMQACGWFITQIVKRTDKTDLSLTSVETEYTLRDEGVPQGCYLGTTTGYTCAACRKIIT